MTGPTVDPDRDVREDADPEWDDAADYPHDEEE